MAKVVWFGCAFLLVQPELARAQGASGAGCTHDTLPVAGNPVAVTVCVTSSRRVAATQVLKVGVDETFAGRGKAFTRSASLDFLVGQQTARTIDDVALERLGLAGTLHLSLLYSGGLVSIAHALLLPGAVPLQ